MIDGVLFLVIGMFITAQRHITAQTTTLALLKMYYSARSILLAALNESFDSGSLNGVVCAHVIRPCSVREVSWNQKEQDGPSHGR